MKGKFNPVVFLVFFGLFWSGMTLLFDCFTLFPAVKQWKTTDYISTEGTILSSEVKESHGSKGPTYSVEVGYEYEVGGHRYVGNRYQFGLFSSSSDFGWANAFVASHPPGTKVPVYYDPQEPPTCVLIKGIQGFHLFMATFMTPFNMVMLGFWYLPLQFAWRRWTRPVAGGVKLKTGLRVVRVRMTVFSPVMVVLTMVGLLAFLSIFPIAFLNREHSLHAMKVAWGFIIAGGIIAGVVHAIQILYGKYDLIIDDLHGFLELPPTHGRKSRRRIPFANVTFIRVDTIDRIGNKGSKTTAYAPTLVVRGSRPFVEKLAEWNDREQARQFVEWLPEKVPAKQPASRPLSQQA